ncbi:DUF4817 domain-containing protein [Trichonephila clavipes]|nr:DUF4817 domain-containing protein [Trichonephila clavipes]
MLSAPDKALLVKLFYMNKESATIALRKFRVQKNVKSGKSPLTPACLLKLVKRFEETGKLEDRARAGRPCLKEARAPCIALEMEAIASEVASGTSRAREAARRLGLPQCFSNCRARPPAGARSPYKGGASISKIKDLKNN